MAFDTKEIGNHIARLRKSKGLTQNELGERLYVSFQAVSKWERGESMPDISLLTDLAAVLETTTDNILSGGKKMTSYSKKITVKDAKEAIDCFNKVGKLLGKDNAFYIGAIEGINNKMNIEFEEYINDNYTYEALVAEAIIQCINCGAYVDISDVNREFNNERWAEIIKKYAEKSGIK
ncbi:MAG: helix-turn-helix transcriptional regulator [Clostridia bacterium]|nr:helix-turn-helix transcriptional regulator [Clostridia bacterium]